MKYINYKLFSIIVSNIFLLFLLTGCQAKAATTLLNIQYTELPSEKIEKAFALSPTETELHLNGKIKFKSGSVTLSIQTKNTGHLLYQKNFNAEDSGKFSIDIVELEHEYDLLFIIEGTDVIKFNLELQSNQTLTTQPDTLKTR